MSVQSFWVQMREYCGFDEAAAERVRSARPVVEPHYDALVDAFYEELDRHADARAIFSGEGQRGRLKRTLQEWLRELFTGPYDMAYFEKRLRIGRRHVEIGLPQRFMFGGMAILRGEIVRILLARGEPSAEAAVEPVGRILDLELAVMLESYGGSRIDLERAETLERALALEVSLRSVENAVSRLAASETALEDVCRGLATATGFEIVSIWRPGASGRVELVAQHGIDPAYAKGLDLPVEETLSRDVARSTEPIFVQGAKDDPNVTSRMVRELGLDTVLSLPIRSGAEVLGVLSLSSRTRIDLPEIQRGVLQSISYHIGSAWKTHMLLARQAEAERVETVARFSRVLAHEVRNPLNAMSLQATLMRRRLSQVAPDTRAQIETALSASEQETKRLNELVEHYLLIGRSGQLRREVADLEGVLRTVLGVHEQALAEARIELALDLGADVRLEIDVPKVTQVLHNLVRNAIDALAGGGRLRVRTRVEDGMARIEFADTGPGVSHPEKVFEPFFTTKSLGTGLGLPVAREIARAHGGDLTLASGTRIGAEFVLSLPIAAVRSREEERTGSGAQ